MIFLLVGNYPLYIILRQGHYELRVDLEDWEGNKRFAKYRHFWIGSPEELYRLYVFGYSGNAGKICINTEFIQPVLVSLPI